MAKINNIAFENLRVEMARKCLTIKEISGFLGISRDTLACKLSRKRSINLDEALRIAKYFFPECDIYYLFKELVEIDNSREIVKCETIKNEDKKGA